MKKVFFLIYALIGLSTYQLNGQQFPALNPTFGKEGITTLDLGGENEVGNVIGIQSSGKAIIGGIQEVNDDDIDKYYLRRLNLDGTIDKSFGMNGEVSGLELEQLDNLEILPDDKIVLSGTHDRHITGKGFLSYSGVLKFDKNGFLDSVFGNNGLDTFCYKPEPTVFTSNKEGVMVAGIGYRDNIELIKYDVNGNREINFGDNGKVIIPIELDLYGSITSIKMDSEDRIIIGGTKDSGFCCGFENFLLLRLEQNGQFDGNFGDDGIVELNIGGFGVDNGLKDIIITKDDGIYATAYIDDDDYLVGLVKFDVNGELDSSFGSNGMAFVSVSSGDAEFTSLIETIDKKILIAGRINQDGFIIKFLPDGTLDKSYYERGYKFTSFGKNSYERLEKMVYNSITKNFLVIGTTTVDIDAQTMDIRNVQDTDISLLNLNIDGTINNDFGYQGQKTFSLVTTYAEEINHVIVQPDGKILIAVRATLSTNQTYLIRILPNGQIDKSFGNHGKILFTTSASNDAVFLLQSDEKIIFLDPKGIYRLTTDGALDSDFGDNGKIIITNGNNQVNGSTIHLRKDGKIIFAGETRINFKDKLFFARLNQDGSLDSSFGENGIKILEFGARDNRLISFKTNEDNQIIVLASFNNSSSFSDFKRVIFQLNSDASINVDFGDNGFSIFEDDNYATKLYIQKNGKILVGGNWDKILRLNSDGIVDNTFGENGIFESSINDLYIISTFFENDEGNIFLFGTDIDQEKLSVGILSQNGNYLTGENALIKLDLFEGLRELPTSINILPDGDILLAGHIRPEDPFYLQDIFIAKFYPFNVITSVEESEIVKNENFIITPNPSIGKIQLKSLATNNIKMLKGFIYSANGKLVRSFNTELNQDIDINTLKNGLYIFILRDKNGYSWNKKLIVQKFF